MDDESISELSVCFEPFKENVEIVKDAAEDEAGGVQHIRIEVFERAYIEEYHHRDFSQIQYTLAPFENSRDDLSEPQKNKAYFKAMHDLLHPLITRYTQITGSSDVIKNIQPFKTFRNQIEPILDITPFEGFLPPNECQLVSFRFSPQPYSSIKMSAACNVLGGATRNVYVKGESSVIGYKLHADYIDFGRQVWVSVFALLVLHIM